MKLLSLIIAAAGAITATISNQAFGAERVKNRRLRLKNYYIQRAHRPRRKGQRQRATVTQSQLALALARVSKRQRAMRQFQLMMNTAQTYAN